jgi:hypothetical protein
MHIEECEKGGAVSSISMMPHAVAKRALRDNSIASFRNLVLRNEWPRQKVLTVDPPDPYQAQPHLR